VGLVLGGAAGAGLSLAVIRLHQGQFQNSEDMIFPLLQHLALWAPLGAAAGIAFALGRGNPRKILAGVAVAVILYDPAGATLFPLDQTSLPISKSPRTRFLARLMVALGAGAGIVLASERLPLFSRHRAKTRIG
jgi:hypothetical protein